MQRSARADGRPIRQIAKNLSAATNQIEAAAYGRALFEVFDSHQRKENDLILPLLVDSDAVLLAELMRSAHANGHDPGHSH